MMHHRHQQVFLVGDPEKCCPQRNLGGQIKRVTHHRADGLLKPVGRPAAGINNVPAQTGPLRRYHHLLGHPFHHRENRAQALMAAHHIGQRGTQRLDVKAPTQPQHHRNVVNR